MHSFQKCIPCLWSAGMSHIIVTCLGKCLWLESVALPLLCKKFTGHLYNRGPTHARETTYWPSGVSSMVSWVMGPLSSCYATWQIVWHWHWEKRKTWALSYSHIQCETEMCSMRKPINVSIWQEKLISERPQTGVVNDRCVSNEICWISMAQN